MGQIANSSGIAEQWTYAQVVAAVGRLHAAQRITRIGLSRARRYSVPEDIARMTSVGDREPRLGDTVWGRSGMHLWYGQFKARQEALDQAPVYTVGSIMCDRIAHDAARLVAEIEREGKK
jgi:hypothetical protein